MGIIIPTSRKNFCEEVEKVIFILVINQHNTQILIL